MDKDKLEQRYSEIFEDSSESIRSKPKKAYARSKPKLDIGEDVHDILEQRKLHRERLLKFLIWLTIYLVSGFTILTVVKLLYRGITGNELVSDTVLNIIGVSLFAEVIAVIHSISKALWDETAVLPSLVQQLKDEDE